MIEREESIMSISTVNPININPPTLAATIMPVPLVITELVRMEGISNLFKENEQFELSGC